MRIKTEIVINAPATKIWNILTDLENYQDWNPFIIKSSGEVKVGKQITNTMKNGDKNMTFKPTICNVVENEYFDWLGSLWFKGIFDGQHYFSLEPLNDKQTKLIHGENFSGILRKMILKKIGTQTKENFVKMNHALKEFAERYQNLN
jgi:hypothetical protein